MTLAFMLLHSVACHKIEEPEMTVEGNFEALWSVIDQHYCFFDLKEIDWLAVHDKYHAQLAQVKTVDAFFDLLGGMLNELRDGHVSLVSPFDISTYDAWWSSYPLNYNSYIIYNNYLRDYYRTAAGWRYVPLFRQDLEVGYVSYRSFSTPVAAGNILSVFSRFRYAKGLILDLRENGGGNLMTATTIASFFADKRRVVGYNMHKTGSGHADFSEPKPIYINPVDSGGWGSRPVVVLTNRGCYSATNEFVNYMSNYPNVIIMGDRTGGGGGFPFTSDLPLGWTVRFSINPSLDVEKNHIEEGIEPDVKLEMLGEDELQGRDTYIESAITLILDRQGLH